MRFLMIVTSVIAYWFNGLYDKAYAAKPKKI